ncbi:hypothetical protein [Achromobacter xylosoxidans]|uniref:Uncharacterized protein n=1 Tax=Alcaligenes xylosoxydans xylosoxydans TaxID=85698 RepID=A0A0X8NXT9_ALCXX|nr:hypothetical protein [Achromobacter xylosoxidans]AMG36286.1 hypothetical protein AL504_09740 [Achromobacter xylosoxidans]
MTQQDDITQPVLTDDEIIKHLEESGITFMWIEGQNPLHMTAGSQQVDALLEGIRALLSKLRAPVADDMAEVVEMAKDDRATFPASTVRKLFELKERYRMALASAPVADERALTTEQRKEFIRRTSYISEADRDTRAAFVDEIARVALASAPVADERALTTEQRKEFIRRTSYISEADRDTRAAFVDEIARVALASAPVAVEHPDGLRILLAELPSMREDPKHGDAVFRCGVNGGLNAVEGRIRELLRSTPVAGEADNTDYIGLALELESAAKRVESQTVQRAIEAGAHGLRLAHSFRNAAPQASAGQMQAALQKSFDMGKFYGSLPETDAEDVRNAALEEAAKLMDQTSRGSGAALIRALKQPQADKDGGQQRAGDVDERAVLDGVRAALPEFRQQDDYLLAHGASLMSENSHEIIHIDTVRRIIRAALSATQPEQGERDEA